MKKIIKTDIENLAKEIKKWAAVYKIRDYSLLYNGKFWYSELYKKTIINNGIEKQRWARKRITEKDIDPHKYCEWFPEKFILGFCVDGDAYECLNGYNKYKAREKLDAILASYGLYLENCDGCHFSVEVWKLDIEEVEYTYWPKEKIVYLYGPNRSNDGLVLPELNIIMQRWYDLAKETGDHGCCTIGEYMEFKYKGIKYRMSSQSPYQGDYSWSVHVPVIKAALIDIGATDIHMNYGRMD